MSITARDHTHPLQDVKLENLLLDASCNLKLADFGLAIDQKFEKANTRLGTFGWVALFSVASLMRLARVPYAVPAVLAPVEDLAAP